LTHDRLALRVREINRDRSFAAIGRRKISGIRRVPLGGVTQKRGPPAAGVVAYARALDFDDLGTQVSKVLAAEGAGQNSA
jgi:hypothetical protein